MQLRRDLLKAMAMTPIFGAGLAQAQPSAADKPQYGGTLTVALQNDAKSLDPTFQINFSERQPLYLIFNTLVGLAPDFTILPELAERWETSGDGRRLVLHLRGGVKFQDGTPFNAGAAKWNLDRRMDAKVNSPSRLPLLELISSIEAPDDNTLVLNLKGPAPSLLGMLAQREGFMISPQSAEKYGDAVGQNPVGTGPFVFKEWSPGARIVVEKNPNYWEGGKPYLDRIVFVLTSNSAVGIPRLITRELDFVGALSPLDIRPLEKQSGIKLAQSPGSRWLALQMRVDRPPFDNLKLRQAMAHAIDRQRLINIVMDGKATIADGFTPPGLWWFDPALRSYPYDPAKAKALLAEIGPMPGLELALSTQPVALYQQISQLAQEQLKAIGLTVKLQPVSVSDWYPQLIQGAINFLPIRWTQRPDPDGLFTYLFHGKSAANTSRYVNPEVDSLLDKARGLSDQSERARLYREAQALMTHDLPYIPLFFSIEFAAMRDNVRNFTWVADEIPRFREVWKAAQ
ncbi:ABC transporter substrate-binding protein [Limobrevibacterium gyesilva]|uniref:ABC transporter substrate-binding protein n=1 Tax=Limobrevibacterium gyesilva TaxID=2991712 RepID=A0AA41YQF8_9PROT|nr:ABC transporter substrate-binding protein [Limobrevibacterium gyesilva]MCW3474743.1 ABC transporter substrate-binding protein [Limobrevibacterium gyesilva]